MRAARHRHGSSLGALLAMAAVAALLANVVNNLPAVLVLLPIVSTTSPAHGPGMVLATLIGVNIGPNLIRRIARDPFVAPNAS